MDKLAVLTAIEVARETIKMLKARGLSPDMLAVVIASLIGAQAKLRDQPLSEVAVAMGVLAEILGQIVDKHESLDSDTPSTQE